MQPLCIVHSGGAPTRSHGTDVHNTRPLFSYIRKLVYTLTRNYFLQDLDEKRIKNIKNFMLSSVDVERKVFPIIMQCLDGMETAANSINEKEVILLFIYFMSNAITLLVLSTLVLKQIIIINDSRKIW